MQPPCKKTKHAHYNPAQSIHTFSDVMCNSCGVAERLLACFLMLDDLTSLCLCSRPLFSVFSQFLCEQGVFALPASNYKIMPLHYRPLSVLIHWSPDGVGCLPCSTTHLTFGYYFHTMISLHVDDLQHMPT